MVLNTSAACIMLPPWRTCCLNVHHHGCSPPSATAGHVSKLRVSRTHLAAQAERLAKAEGVFGNYQCSQGSAPMRRDAKATIKLSTLSCKWRDTFRPINNLACRLSCSW